MSRDPYLAKCEKAAFARYCKDGLTKKRSKAPPRKRWCVFGKYKTNLGEEKEAIFRIYADSEEVAYKSAMLFYTPNIGFVDYEVIKIEQIKRKKRTKKQS